MWRLFFNRLLDFVNKWGLHRQLEILRRDGVLKKLNDLKYNAYDTEMSIAEAENGIS